jgi:hypothetical protein
MLRLAGINILGLPSTRAISRRYQYGFPLIVFLYKLVSCA